MTALTMAGGVLLCSLSLGLSEGTYSNLIDMFTRDRTGHIQVHKEDYLDKPSLYKTLGNLDLMGERIASLPGVEGWAPRVFSPTLAAVGKKTAGAQVVGVHPLREASATRLKGRVSAGRFLSEQPSGEVMLGRGLAGVLKAQVGDEIVLIGQAADGSIANDLFRVVGTIGDSKDVRERITCYMHIKTAQAFLALEGRVHELAVVLTDHTKSASMAGVVRGALDDPSLDVAPWQVVEAAFYQAMRADLKGTWISLGIIMAIVGIGVLNTVLMTILERTREFGVLRALGTRPKDVFKLIVLETVYLSVLSILLGGAAGLAGNYLLSVYGIVYPIPIEYGGFMIDRMVGKVSFQAFWVPTAITIGTAVVVSVFPALRAARVTPVKAMRSS